MSTVVTRPRPHAAGTANGGVPARRAVIHWSWRLFRREWRQQLLVLALIVVAVGATVVAAAVAVNTPPAANAGFGTAHDLATFTSPGPKLAADIAALQDKYGRVDVIENQALTIPGSIQSYDLRAQNPDGPFGQPMLSLLSGHYPAAADQVALTPGLAADLGLKVGDAYHQGAQARTVVGIVQNPQSLLDEFALVIPGQVTHPTAVSVLFDAPPGVSSIGPRAERPDSRVPDRVQPAEPDDDRPRAGHHRHAAHRPGVGGRLHRAGAAPAARARDARRAGRHGPERPPGRPGQRGRGGRGRRAGRPGGRPGRLAGLPAEGRAERAPPDRRVRAAVGGDRPGAGAGRAGHVLRRLPARPRHHQDVHRGRPVRPARAAEAGPPLGPARRRLRRDRGPRAVVFRPERQ